MSSKSAEKNPSPEERRQRERDRILLELKRRSPNADGIGCFLCKWIAEDIEKNGAMTGYPIDHLGGPVFPRQGKVAHLRLEGFLLPT
jgi:hypothetical protein